MIQLFGKRSAIPQRPVAPGPQGSPMESEFNYAGQTGGIGTPSPSSQSLIDQSQKGLSNPFTEIRKLYDRLTKSKAKPQI